MPARYDRVRMHPEEFTDTDPKAMEVWLDLQRTKSPGEKLAIVLGASQLLLQFYEMGVRRRYPQACDREVLLRIGAIHLPRELMIRAYGWDPEGDASPV